MNFDWAWRLSISLRCLVLDSFRLMLFGGYTDVPTGRCPRSIQRVLSKKCCLPDRPDGRKAVVGGRSSERLSYTFPRTPQNGVDGGR